VRGPGEHGQAGGHKGVGLGADREEHGQEHHGGHGQGRGPGQGLQGGLGQEDLEGRRGQGSEDQEAAHVQELLGRVAQDGPQPRAMGRAAAAAAGLHRFQAGREDLRGLLAAQNPAQGPGGQEHQRHPQEDHGPVAPVGHPGGQQAHRVHHRPGQHVGHGRGHGQALAQEPAGQGHHAALAGGQDQPGQEPGQKAARQGGGQQPLQGPFRGQDLHQPGGQGAQQEEGRGLQHDGRDHGGEGVQGVQVHGVRVLTGAATLLHPRCNWIASLCTQNREPPQCAVFS